MNRKMVFNVVGKILLSEALLLVLPIIVALIYKESCVLHLIITALIALVVGSALVIFLKPKNQVIYAKEGFVIVALSWISMSIIGALPFFLSGEIPSYVDAFFETVSGFTTTGASIIPNVEIISKSLLFWRSFTHWIGGMGILVFIMAIIPNTTDRSIHIMRAEMSGHLVGKLLPRVKDTAKILYIIYISLTGLQIILLCCCGMSLYESLIHTFSTAGLGGFSANADSISGYSPYIQWVITIFMLIFGVNFNIYYLIIMKKIGAAVKSAEMRVYFAIVIISSTIITINVLPIYKNVWDSIRYSTFQVSSILTTTGFSTTNFNLWPELSKVILISLMFIGGCSGSTAGGFKISRLVILLKQLKNELRRMLHPRSVNTVKFEEKVVNKETLNGVNTYLFIYILCFFAIFLIISIEPFDFLTNFSAVASCFNNIGIGLSSVGPGSNYSLYSDFSKIILSLSMLLGRLEIFPLILSFSPSTWSKK